MNTPLNTGWTQNINYATAPIQTILAVKKDGLSPDDFITVRDRLLVLWDESKKKLETAKEDEMTLRKAFVDFASDETKTSGTENIELGNGYQAKAGKKENYGFIKSAEGKIDKRAIDKALDEIESTVENGAVFAERLINWTPSLSLTEYKQIPASAKAIIDKVIVVTSGAPTLEIKAPKGTK